MLRTISTIAFLLILPIICFAQEPEPGTALSRDDLWVIIAAALVFFMQAGFKVFETGMVKSAHSVGIGAKNLMDWVAGSIAFFIVGFGFMFGDSISGLIGTGYLVGDGLLTGSQFIFFLFQLAFAGTALTIVSGAMSGRTALIPYFIASMVTAIVIYPVFGHWAWGNLLNESNSPWLANLGFMDFAGSTVVHSVGAWIGLTGIWIVGPRLGRFSATGKIQPIQASNYSYSILGVMILWLGWWGFNGGSTLAFNADVPKIILNTNLAGATACFTAFFHCYLFQSKRDIIEKITGGCLTGLVAITACCNVVSPLSSLMIGGLAGIIHNICYVVISEKWKIDDPVGAIAVHGFGGIFGTLSVALFGNAELLALPRWEQLGVQAIGVVVCFGFTASISGIMFLVIKRTIGLRVSPHQERIGQFFGTQETEYVQEELPEHRVSQVAIKISNRGYNIYSIKEYLAVQAETRLKLVKAGRIQYLDENGNQLHDTNAVRQLARIIEDQRDTAIQEKTKVEQEKSNIDKSISYARTIQGAILGEQDNLKDLLFDSFVLFQPKDQVSGDFYWFTKVKGHKVVVLSDCTGHGVPGAFLTVLGVSLLNEIVSQKKVLPPEKILQQLDYRLIYALQNKTQKVKLSDGMDVAVLIINEVHKKIYFSGAKSNLIHVNRGKAEEIKGAKYSLGFLDFEGKKEFTRTVRTYEPGDMIYLTSDGYYDQTNNAGKKIMKSGFNELITTLSPKSTEEQENDLAQHFAKWKGKEEQVDDVLVIGARLW